MENPEAVIPPLALILPEAVILFRIFNPSVKSLLPNSIAVSFASSFAVNTVLNTLPVSGNW